MRKFIQTIAIILVLSSTTVFCQDEQKSPTKFLLKYGYYAGQELKYNKTTFCNNEHYIKKENGDKIVTFLKIKVLDSQQTDNIKLEYALDSTYRFVLNEEPKIKSSKDLELAKVNITYTKTGKEIDKTYLDGNESSYAKNSYYSDNEILFELPTSYISFGKSWKTNKMNKGSDISKTINYKNKLIGIESKNGHNCYRIDFVGKKDNEMGSDHFKQVEVGKVTGSYWVDKDKMIIIAVESETSFSEIKMVHSGMEVLHGKTLLVEPPHKTIFTLIE